MLGHAFVHEHFELQHTKGPFIIYVTQAGVGETFSNTEKLRDPPPTLSKSEQRVSRQIWPLRSCYLVRIEGWVGGVLEIRWKCWTIPYYYLIIDWKTV